MSEKGRTSSIPPSILSGLYNQSVARLAELGIDPKRTTAAVGCTTAVGTLPATVSERIFSKTLKGHSLPAAVRSSVNHITPKGLALNAYGIAVSSGLRVPAILGFYHFLHHKLGVDSSEKWVIPVAGVVASMFEMPRFFSDVASAKIEFASASTAAKNLPRANLPRALAAHTTRNCMTGSALSYALWQSQRSGNLPQSQSPFITAAKSAAISGASTPLHIAFKAYANGMAPSDLLRHIVPEPYHFDQIIFGTRLTISESTLKLAKLTTARMAGSSIFSLGVILSGPFLDWLCDSKPVDSKKMEPTTPSTNLTKTPSVLPQPMAVSSVDSDPSPLVR